MRGAKDQMWARRVVVRWLAAGAFALAGSAAFAGSGIAAAQQAPKNTSPPTISGETQQLKPLAADTGTWSGAQPIKFHFQWRRCTQSGRGCANIPGATSRIYTLRGGDVGHRVDVFVTATNSEGAGTAHSAPSEIVTAAPSPPPPPAPPPPPSGGGCTPIAQISLPERLIVDRIEYAPNVIHSRGEPLVARFHVTTTKGRCVSGALVYAVGVPFDRLSKEPEAQTDGSGVASVTFQILPTFALRPGNLVVIFVRARKPGESVLAGVSTRRLVSVRVG